jgi:hypothetical protein
MTYPLMGSEFQPPGWPDRYLCWGAVPAYGLSGWHGFIEFKSRSGHVGPKQSRVLEDLRERGEQAWVCHVWTEHGDEIHWILAWESECLKQGVGTLALMKSVEALSSSRA